MLEISKVLLRLYELKQDGFITVADYNNLKKRVMAQDTADLELLQSLAKQDVRHQCQSILSLL